MYIKQSLCNKTEVNAPKSKNNLSLMKKTQERYLIELRKQLNKSAMFGSNMLHRHQSLIHSDPQTESFHLEYTVQLLSPQCIYDKC